MNIKVPDFHHFYRGNVKFKTYNGEAVTRNIYAGNISLPSGQIVACDPFVYESTEPFINKVNPGEYPVVLNVVHYLDDDDERIGAAMIRFKESQAVRWEMALKEGQDLSELEEGEAFGYPVDCGVGCFMDDGIYKKYKSILDENPEYDDFIIEEMEKNYVDTRDWANLKIDPLGNIVIFSSGLGDGYYVSYWGYDEKDEICCLVTDFGLYEGNKNRKAALLNQNAELLDPK
ncbi:DUF4241 domain-containing protein [Thermoactinomyces sp. CICC 10521]|jgi:hypothetical protein|uniref:DUF4241 domain-containing protein n=1 Tax=Thermoactinomyces sp. CICC 10521 TaxID=2767426 RepID=UPI0018DE2E46|nr:DUF4241 domain-containing protein [Thermoactinomyces sp. CICC 10521]MBH8606729.1 DUF4241 domain-containing protein [Thermoactinomyces sp. CICC 10521]